jgi:DNA-binding NtrC family response regulator
MLDALVAELIEKGILFEEACSEFERRFLQRALERARGNRTLAAQTLGIHRNTLSRRLRELNLAAPKPSAAARARAAGV